MMKQHKIDGYLLNGCIDLLTCVERHEALLAEAKSRGLKTDKYHLSECDLVLVKQYQNVRMEMKRKDPSVHFGYPEAIAGNIAKLIEKSRQGKYKGKTCEQRMREAGMVE